MKNLSCLRILERHEEIVRHQVRALRSLVKPEAFLRRPFLVKVAYFPVLIAKLTRLGHDGGATPQRQLCLVTLEVGKPAATCVLPPWKGANQPPPTSQ